MIFEKSGHGGDIYTRPCICDFSANINPLGTPESVRRAVIESADKIAHYPDPCCRELLKKIAESEEVSPSWVMCGNGAADLIFSFCAAARPKTALELAPTFSEYSAALESVGCCVDRYPLSRGNGFALTDSFLSALQEKRFDAVFLCNPNNPTGRLVPQPLLEEICRLCAKLKTRLFLDECFLDLSDGKDAHSMKRLLGRFPNLFILKAFTKNYGMAGLRLGYCLCADGDLLKGMSRTTQVWNVSIPAQQAGLAALEEREFLNKAAAIVLQERKKLTESLRALDFEVCQSEANYILFYTAQPVEKELSARGILIRNCENYCGLTKGWYRIAVKSKEENELLISALHQISGD